MLAAPSLSAQETDTDEDDVAVQEVVVITGSRGQPRSVADSAVPVDVLSTEDIAAVPFTDTQDVLKTLVPSFVTTRQPISDGATFIRPATLRGLPSDKTLVLVNSKRRHRAALVSTGGSGTQGPDVATIPASAIKTVEVLRDGAAAQYGSDAIAGVINFILKDAPEGGSLTFQAGGYSEGDGEDILVAGNIGIPILDSGFVNISVEATTTQGTNRGRQWDGTAESFSVFDYLAANPQDAFLYGPGGDFDTSNVQIWGQPEAQAVRAFVNAGYTFENGAELYAFANYSNSESDGDFNFRNPEAGINNTPVRTPDGSIFQFRDRFQAGFTPRFGGNIIDYSVTAGVRGEFTDDFFYDFTGRYGSNTIYYTLWNTVNPSLGESSPDFFSPGDLISDEYALNADFVYEWDAGYFASPITVAFGAEYRDEGYELVEGDVASYIAGPYAFADPYGFCDATTLTPTAAGATVIAAGSTLDCADADDPVYNVAGVGSNGFPGYDPDFVGSFNRDSQAVYVDFAADVTDSFFANISIRAENFSDFGETLDGKIAGRLKVTEFFNLRGSIGTGFRAPTPGQLSTTNVATIFDGGTEPIARGLFPATNPVSASLGAQPLDPEKSVNISFGGTASFGDLSLTVDAYQIEIEDQFQAVSNISVTDEIRADLLAAGVPGADTVGRINFFQNAFDSKTSGVDVVATYTKDWGDSGTTTLTGSLNFNEFEIESVNISNTQGTDDPSDDTPLFNDEAVFDFENASPNTRGVFTVQHEIDALTLLARANYYGEFTVSNFLTGNPDLQFQEFGSEVQFDLEGTYAFTDDFAATLGVRNVTDEYPDEGDPALRETTNGRIYRSDSVADWQGTFYYLRLSKMF